MKNVIEIDKVYALAGALSRRLGDRLSQDRFLASAHEEDQDLQETIQQLNLRISEAITAVETGPLEGVSGAVYKLYEVRIVLDELWTIIHNVDSDINSFLKEHASLMPDKK